MDLYQNEVLMSEKKLEIEKGFFIFIFSLFLFFYFIFLFFYFFIFLFSLFFFFSFLFFFFIYLFIVYIYLFSPNQSLKIFIYQFLFYFYFFFTFPIIFFFFLRKSNCRSEKQFERGNKKQVYQRKFSDSEQQRKRRNKIGSRKTTNTTPRTIRQKFINHINTPES